MNKIIPSTFKSSKSSRRNQKRRQKRREYRNVIGSVLQETYKPIKEKVSGMAKSLMPADLYDLLGAGYKGVGRGVRKNRRKRLITSPKPTSSIGSKQEFCGAQLLECAMNPFSFSGEICLPVSPMIPTFKTKIITNLTITAGTNGVAFFLYAPCLTNDPSIYYTNHNYAGTTYADETTVTGVLAAQNGSLFTASQFATDYGEGAEPLTGRINMISIQVTPLASFMNRKGLLRLSVDPNKSSLAGLSGTDCSNWHTTITYNMATLVSTSPTPSITVMAGSTQELALKALQGINTQDVNNRFPWSQEITAQGGVYGAGMIGVFVDGAAAYDAFNVRMITRVEYAGALVSSYSTLGASNHEAYDYVSSWLSQSLFDQSQVIH